MAASISRSPKSLSRPGKGDWFRRTDILTTFM